MPLSVPLEKPAGLTLDRTITVAVPVGLAVVTWLGLLLTVGFFVRLNRVSLLNFLPVFFIALLFWPVSRAAPWREGAAGRVRDWARERTAEFAVIVGLALFPLVPFVPDLLLSLLQLPYRGSGVFFGASLFYRERVGPLAGRVLLWAAQTYVQLLWLYLLSTGLVGLGRRLR